MNTLPLDRLGPETAREVHRTRDSVTLVDSDGRAIATVVDADELERLQETLDVMSEPGALAEIRQTLDEIAAGRTEKFDTDALAAALEARRTAGT